MGTKCPSAASPGDPLVSFLSLGKKLAPQGETLAKRRAESSRPTGGSDSFPAGGHMGPPLRANRNIAGRAGLGPLRRFAR